jgi:hypothetical protein
MLSGCGEKVMRNIILVDLDHTVFDSFWRDEMIGISGWDDYHAKLIHDDPAPDFAPFLKYFIDSKSISGDVFIVIGLTARPEKWRALSLQSLAKHGIKLDDLWMRRDGDFRPAGDIKLSLCEEKLGVDWRERILLIIDDNDRVIEAFKGENITCLQIFNRRI